MKKFKSFFLLAVLISFVVIPLADAKALSVEELKAQIATLTAQLKSLQEQLVQAQGNQGVFWCHNFDKNLKYGDSGDEVVALQTALEKDGFSIPQEEKDKNFFGEQTASIVSGFQQKYNSEILSPLGLKYGTGVIASATRGKLNKLFNCKQSCAQVITPAKNPTSNECKNFPTPCDVPTGWTKVDSCQPCPMYSPPAPDWCKDGKIVSGGKDENGCALSPKCVPTTCAKESNFCGGIAGIQCCSGLTCKMDGDYPDAGGKCITSTTPSITVLSPNGGENWQIGTTQTIKWNYSNAPTNAKVGLYLKQGAPCVGDVCATVALPRYVIAENIDGNATYDWVVTTHMGGVDLSAGQYRVLVCPAGSQTNCDFSDKTFNITTSTTQPSGIILFYGTGCPHCANVDNYITANNIAQKVNFIKLETFSNTVNADFMKSDARACGLDSNAIGVPFLWDGSKCYVGDTDVIGFFSKYISTSNQPSITSISPTKGPIGVTMTIRGSGFNPREMVNLGGLRGGINIAVVSSNNGTTLTFSIPTQITYIVPNIDVPYAVCVIRNDACGSNSVNFTVTPSINPTQPHITSVSPTSGPVGTKVTVAGSGFGSNETLAFGGTSIFSYSSDNGSTLTFTIPQNNGTTTGSYPVCVINAVDSTCGSNSVTFTVTATPPCLDGAGSLLPGQVYCANSLNTMQDNLASISVAVAQVVARAKELLGR
jgi:hypothetical protein